MGSGRAGRRAIRGEAAIQRVKRLGTRYQSRATILLDRAVLSANVGDRREAQRLVQLLEEGTQKLLQGRDIDRFSEEATPGTGMGHGRAGEAKEPRKVGCP